MRKWLSFILALSSFALFIATLRSGVLPADSGEFQWVAATLGVAHPPGFPLYTVLAYLFTLLPGEAAWNVNLFSAVTSACSIWFLSEMILLILVHPQSDPYGRQSAAPLPLLHGVVCALASLLLTTSTTFWAQATTANIRSLTALFAAILFYLFARYEAITFRSDQHGRIRAGGLAIFVLALSLSVTHHLSLLFIGIVLAGLMAFRSFLLFTRVSVWIRLLAAGLIGLLPWLYLPWREPELRQPITFLRYVLGLDFSSDFFFVSSWPQFVERVGVMGNVLTFQFSGWLLLAALLGWLWMMGRRTWLASGLGGAFLMHIFIAATYRAPQTVEYMLPAYIPIVITFAYGVGSLLDRISQRLISFWPNRAALESTLSCSALTLVLLLSGPKIGRDWTSYRTLAAQTDTYETAMRWLAETPPDGLILADWHWFTPLNYLTVTEGLRPDLDIDYRPGRDWNASIRDGLAASRPVLSTHYDPEAFAGLPSAWPVGEGLLYLVEPINDRAFNVLSEPLELEQAISIVGVQQTQPSIFSGELFEIDLYWQTEPNFSPETSLFIHLVGSDGAIYAQSDLLAQAQSGGLSKTGFRITPRPGLPLGEATLMIGAYRLDRTPLLDQNGEARSFVGTVDVIGSSWVPYTANRLRGERNDLGWEKYGTDWDRTIPGEVRQYVHWRLPDGSFWTEVLTYPAAGGEHPVQHYVPFGQGIVWTGSTPRFDTVSLAPGTVIAPTQHFVSTRPILRDIGVAVRLIGLEEDEFTWAWLNPDEDSDIPATGAIPTLKWVIGSRVDHPRRLTIPLEAEPGQRTEGFMRLYDTFTREPVPILDERIANSGRPWVVFDAGIIEGIE
ncbi:MAG: DUF2723 domain-containing protein [Chloroflexota bacterium]